MAVDKQGATVSDSPTGETTEENSHSAEGKKPQKSVEQLLSEYQAENSRKSSEISELRQKVDELLEAKEERLEELNEKNRLTQSEQAEFDSLESQIALIKSDKRSRPWLEINVQESKRTARELFDERELIIAEHKITKLAKKEGKDYKDFEKELVKLMPMVDPKARLPLSIRVDEAYDYFLEHKRFLQEKEEFEKEKQKRNSFAESGGQRQSKPQDDKELWSRAKESDTDMARLLSKIADSQEASRTK